MRRKQGWNYNRTDCHVTDWNKGVHPVKRYISYNTLILSMLDFHAFLSSADFSQNQLFKKKKKKKKKKEKKKKKKKKKKREKNRIESVNLFNP